MSMPSFYSQCPAHKPILHIEARVRASRDDLIIRTDLIRDGVAQWLTENFAVLSLRQEIRSFDRLQESHARLLDLIIVTECSGDTDSRVYHLEDVELDVQAYQLRVQNEQNCLHLSQGSSVFVAQAEGELLAKVLVLPSQELDGLWESLLFDQPVQTMLLNAISRMASLSARKLDRWTVNWNRLVLLWGPPGTGKTSFCRGIAQKLAIRLGKQYPRGKLIEINAQALGSKFYGESGKLVSKFFEDIEALLEDDDTFVCIFIDEVETLAARRERSLSSNEPFDAIRAVNALLTGLDKLKDHANVVVLCTSNLVTALDPAFFDRVDIKQFMPLLSNRVIYELYRECLEELSRCGIIEGASFDVIQVDQNDPQTQLQYVEQPGDCLILPNFDEMLLSFQMFPDAVPTQLASIASASIGISGRTVRRLPVLSLVLHTSHTRCNVREALEALKRGVEGEKAEQ